MEKIERVIEKHIKLLTIERDEEVEQAKALRVMTKKCGFM
jgi:hypothetical protein